jgi:transcriptional regulator with XRE-family HTH domain
MSQADVVTASAMSRESLARLELGQQDPTFGTLWKLATVLKVTVGELVA